MNFAATRVENTVESSVFLFDLHGIITDDLFLERQRKISAWLSPPLSLSSWIVLTLLLHNKKTHLNSFS